MTPFDPTATQDPRVLQRVPTLLQPPVQNPQIPVAAGAAPNPVPTPPRVLPRVQAPAQQMAEPPAPSAAVQRLQQLQATRPGVENIKNPVGRTLARIGDVILGTFSPRAEALTPGTEGNYAQRIAGAQRAVKAEQEGKNQESEEALRRAEAANYGAKAPLHEAQAREANARANALEHPEQKLSPESEQKTIETDQGIFQWNPQSKRYDISVGKGKSAKENGTVHTLDDGSMIIARPDGTAVPVTMNGQPVKAPQRATGEHIIERNVGGKPHSIMVDAQGNDVKDLGEKFEKPTEAAQGTWQLEEQNGKPVLFNSKTGATRPAPEGLAKTGTAERQAAPHDALVYAQDYLKGGNFTGPGDEALMEKFFELAKPSTGFRMNQAQQQMLMQTRDLVQGLTARAKHALDPNAPYFDNTQRQHIVQTMADLANSKGIKTEGGGAAAQGGYKVGSKYGGLTYQGGDPNKRENWK